MSAKKPRRTIVLAIRNAFSYIAFWQMLSFVVLILLVWVNELLDLSHLFWNTPPSAPSLARGCLASAGVLMGMVITIGHTYVQQRNIISGVLTICSYCHRIRIDQEVWQRIEQYVTSHSTIMLSHGICPDCYGNVMRSVTEDIARGAAATEPRNVPPT
jgi:hypothetical protein